MSRQQITHHYSRLLTRWPVDLLRPEAPTFQSVLKKRLQAGPSSHADEAREVNAAYLLLDNTFSRQYPLSEKMMHPASNPNHYTDLARELEEAPHRTWMGNMMKRLQNIVRFQ